MGIRQGDPIVPICPFTVMVNDQIYMGKAFDNRGGCLAANTKLRNLLFDTAEEEGIPYQFGAAPGVGTDAGAAHLIGTDDWIKT